MEAEAREQAVKDQLVQELQWRNRPETEPYWRAFELDERFTLGPARCDSLMMGGGGGGSGGTVAG